MRHPSVHHPRRAHRAAAVLVAVVAMCVAAPPASAFSCAVAWGSTAKSAGDMAFKPVTGARAATHPCYDRLVIDLRGSSAGWRVRYVSQVIGDGSGEATPLRGGAKLQVTVLASAYDSSGRPTYAPARPSEAVNTSGFETFRQVAYVSSFEGITTFGLGVRGRLPFRVFAIAGPGTGSRLVIDVAHHW